MNSESLISVVIVNYNRKDDLRAAIISIQAQDYPDFEIIVVDNACTDRSAAMLSQEFPMVKTILLDRNIGMDGYSVGCRAARGGIIFQMDNDALMPHTTVLSRIAAAFAQAASDVAVMATRVEEYRNETDNIEELQNRDRRCGPLATEGYHAGGVAFRRALMDQVGYYNEDVFLYGAEWFVQLNVLAAGLKLCLYPDILMLHKSSQTARSTMSVYYEARNRYWLMRHYGTIRQQFYFLPWMLMHDLIYALHKRAIGHWFKAVVHGFGKLPVSLGRPLRSPEPLFQQALKGIGATYSPAITFQRIVRSIRKRQINAPASYQTL